MTLLKNEAFPSPTGVCGQKACASATLMRMLLFLGEKLREGLPADQPGGEWHAHGGHQSGNSRYAPFMGDAACSENSRSVPV